MLSKDVKEIQGNITKTWNKYNTSSKIQQCLDLSPMDLMLVSLYSTWLYTIQIVAIETNVAMTMSVFTDSCHPNGPS